MAHDFSERYDAEEKKGRRKEARESLLDARGGIPPDALFKRRVDLAVASILA